MKRVLNSGTIKLPHVEGLERSIFQYQNDLSTDEYLKLIFSGIRVRLEQVAFTFEIKAPLLTFLTFQDSNLGTLNRIPKLDHPIAYVPPQFYKKGNEVFDSKACNTYHTKLYNFHCAALNFYNKLKDEGMCDEQARLVLPQGMLINFLWKVNADELIEFIEKYYNASPEMYGYCSTLVLYLEEHLPLVTRWLKQNNWKDISL